MRAMYKRVGLDPTNKRPSSEALLRRVKRAGAAPRQLDGGRLQLVLARFQLPYGLYDAERIEGAVKLRLGAEGESYPGIRKDEVHVGGRMTLADALGPFGNPTSDSARTMVTIATGKAMVVVFAPADIAPERLGWVLDKTVDRMAGYTGCRETGRWLS